MRIELLMSNMSVPNLPVVLAGWRSVDTPPPY